MSERFWDKVEPLNTGCWLWNAYIDPYGYGTFRSGTKKVKAHRFAYELLRGPIPNGLVLDHLCLNRWCVNPEHLEPVTNRENVQRGAAFRTHCKNGHEFTPENTRPREGGARLCITCARAKAVRHKRRVRAS